MVLHPASELKRRLEDASVPLPKRLCLASNVVGTRYLPTSAKERALGDWLEKVESGREVAASVLTWRLQEAGTQLPGRLVQFLAKYLQDKSLEADMVESIVTFLETDIILPQLSAQIHNFLLITTTLLSHLQQSELPTKVSTCERLFDIIKKTYKTVARKVEFIIKFLDGQTLEVLFNYLNVPELRQSCLKVCETVLFPIAKKAHFVTFLQTIIKKENIDQLLAEKGDNIKSVLKVMSTFFTFPEGRTAKEANFLNNFIDAFVSSFKSDSHLVFTFYIMVVNSLNIQQTYLNPVMTMPAIIFEENDDKIKRNMLMKALERLKDNEIDLNVRLTETLGEKMTKVEIKKNFTAFLQAVILSALKLEGKPDKTSLKIITLALRLDPNLIEPKMDKILPNIMTSKKTNPSIIEAYAEMLNCLLETLFKLSRGTEFISQMLPLLKLQLEAMNTEQFELKQELQELKNDPSSDRIKSKIITGEDLFPKACVDKYGRLSSDLMLKQNGELFVSLQKEFETHCLILLAEGFVSPSLITLSELLAAILSSVLSYSKMADHTVPPHIAQEFWGNFRAFQEEFLIKYGECLLSLSYNRQLTSSFLQLCLYCSNLKLLNARYGNVDTESPLTLTKTVDIFDFSMVLPCLSREQWITITERVRENKDGECVETLNQLMLRKIMFCDLYSSEGTAASIKEYNHRIKSHLIKEIHNLWSLIDNCPHYAQVLFDSLDQSLEQHLSKSLVKRFETEPEAAVILDCVAVSNNKSLLTSLVSEILKNVLKVIEDDEFLKKNKSLRKAIKAGFEFEEVMKGCDVPALFKDLSKSSAFDEENLVTISHNVELLKVLRISSLEENSQLLSLFVILVLKNMLANTKSSKKLKKSIDMLLLDIFEMSPKYPNLLKVFPIEFIFSSEDNTFLHLVTLNKIKTSNRWIVVKATLESAVKKVRTDSEIIKNMVNILLTNQKIQKKDSSNFFVNELFQITCMLLPIIAKEKKAITQGQYRSILADLQEKLHKFLLKSLKNIDFDIEKSLFLKTDDSLDESSTGEMSESTLATMNAVEAYSLTLSKYCESGNTEESSDWESLLASLEYFVENAITAIGNDETKPQHVEASIQLLNIVLRNIRKLATHGKYQEKDKLLVKIWQAIKSRLLTWFREKKNEASLEDMTVTVKFLCELCSIDFFSTHLTVEMSNLMTLKAPAAIINSKNTPNSILMQHNFAKYLWCSALKANVIGPKSAAVSKAMFRTTKNIILWLRANFDAKTTVDKSKDDMIDDRMDSDDAQVIKLSVDDEICGVLTCDLEILMEVIVNAKKVCNLRLDTSRNPPVLSQCEEELTNKLRKSQCFITLNHRFLDAIFELQQSVREVLAADMSLPSFLDLLGAGIASLNSLPVHRNELLEDRWPCYLQGYRGLMVSLCARGSSQLQTDRALEERLAEAAHAFEKLTQAICKQKSQISRLAAYLVADICSTLERTAPSRVVRQHLENCVSLLIQASENTYAMAFLRRALAGNPGQMTMTNLYTMYKRYHKYVGTS